MHKLDFYSSGRVLASKLIDLQPYTKVLLLFLRETFPDCYLPFFCTSSILSFCFALISSSLFLSMYLLATIKDDIPVVAITTLESKEKRKSDVTSKTGMNDKG